MPILKLDGRPIVSQDFFVYILKCSNGSLYTGYTNDLEVRYKEHLAGTGAKYTRSFKPIELAQAWQVFISKGMVMKVESYIKALTRKLKLELIAEPWRLVELFGREVISVDAKTNLK
jgi:putative endonuclease